jgi:hypothetical protein
MPHGADENDPRGSMGLGGVISGGGVSLGGNMLAVDYQTGKASGGSRSTAAMLARSPQPAGCSS